MERPPRGRAKEHVPIDHVLVGLGLSRCPDAGHGGQTGRMGVDCRELTQLAGAGQFGGKHEVRHVTTLHAPLEHARRAAEHIGQGQALLDCLRARLLAVHVLARLGRVDREQRVPVRARGDQHGVDVGARQQFAEIAILAATTVLGLDRPLGALATVGPRVAAGHKPGVGLLHEAAHHVGAAPANPQASHRDLFAGGYRAVFAEHGTGNHVRGGQHVAGAQRGLEEPPPIREHFLLGHVIDLLHT